MVQIVGNDQDGAILKKEWPRSSSPVPTLSPADLREGAHWLASRGNTCFISTLSVRSMSYMSPRRSTIWANTP